MAAVDMYLKIQDIKGESTDTKHKDEIDILSWSWSLTQSGSAHMGPGQGKGKVSAGDLRFEKYVDKASNKLMQFCCDGSSIPEAILYCRKAAGSQQIEYIKITMKECIVSSWATHGSGEGGYVREDGSLNFASAKYEYTPQKTDGKPDAPMPGSWDFAKNAKIS